jgi:drug/metabolite transporter (DMT)-like permease
VLTGGYRADPIGVGVLAACLCAGAGYCLELRSFGNHPTYKNYSSFQQTAWQYVVGGTCMGLTSLFCWDEPDAFASPGPPRELTWIAVAYAVVVASGMNYWIMTWCGRHLEASTLGVYGLIQPFSTAIISYCAFGTAVPLSMILGTAMVAASILMISWQQAIDEAKATRPINAVDTSNERDPLLSLPIND